MKRLSLPDAVRLIANDDEWREFESWRKKPKPTEMLDSDGRFPDVPHELADDLFARLIERLQNAELIGFGRWGQRVEFQEIDPMHWATMWYNIWFNELGYADGGKIGFSSIYVEERAPATLPAAKPQTRMAIKRVLEEWLEANPEARIARPAMLQIVKDALAPSHNVTASVFNGVWLAVIPDRNKFNGRPPTSSK